MEEKVKQIRKSYAKRGACNSKMMSFRCDGNHGNCFYYADEAIKILVALELNWHLSLAKNADGELTPTIHFF